MKTLSSQHRALSLAVALALGLAAIPLATLGAEGTAKAPVTGKSWVMPRTPDGKPDLQGNWTNETQTPFERMGNQGPNLTDAQAAALEKRAKDVQEYRDRPTDPKARAEKGGVGDDPGAAAIPGEPT